MKRRLIKTNGVKELRHKKKFKLENLKSCGICLEVITKRILLHKSEHRTHRLCFDCAETYIVDQLNDNLNKKEYTHRIKCCGLFDVTQRNVCKKRIDVIELKIPKKMTSVHTLTARITALAMPGATACLNRLCKNVVLVPDNMNNASCPECKVAWCQECKVTPYHKNMTCKQYKTMNDSSPEGQQMKNLIAEGKVKLCPTCNHGIERNQGCNMVTCSQCKDIMCWFCSAGKIDYRHFANGACDQWIS